jgi:hypothetical protein
MNQCAAALVLPYAKSGSGNVGPPSILPAAVAVRMNLGLSESLRTGHTAWKRTSGPSVLT